MILSQVSYFFNIANIIVIIHYYTSLRLWIRAQSNVVDLTPLFNFRGPMSSRVAVQEPAPAPPSPIQSVPLRRRGQADDSRDVTQPLVLMASGASQTSNCRRTYKSQRLQHCSQSVRRRRPCTAVLTVRFSWHLCPSYTGRCLFASSTFDQPSQLAK